MISRRHTWSVLTLALCFTVHGDRLGAQSIATHTKADVTALASEKTDGRLAGSPGERAAGDYLASALRRIGAQPLPGRTDYRVAFDFTAGTKDGGTTVAVECGAPARACAAKTFNT